MTVVMLSFLDVTLRRPISSGQASNGGFSRAAERWVWGLVGIQKKESEFGNPRTDKLSRSERKEQLLSLGAEAEQNGKAESREPSGGGGPLGCRTATFLWGHAARLWAAFSVSLPCSGPRAQLSGVPASADARLLLCPEQHFGSTLREAYALF